MKEMLIGLLAPITGITTVLFALLPKLMPKGEYFACQLNLSALPDKVIAKVKALNRRYTQGVCIAGALGLIVLLGASLLAATETTLFVLEMASMLLPIVVGLVLFVRYHALVYRTISSFDKKCEISQEIAVVGTHLPNTVSAVWCVSYLVPILLSALYLGDHYAELPQYLPFHISLSGAIETAAKTPFTVLLPVCIEIFFAIVFTSTILVISRSKQPVDPEYPELSVYAYRRFARAQSLMLICFGLVLISVIAIIMVATFQNMFNMFFAILIFTMLVLIILVAVCWISITYGQNGSRLLARLVAHDSQRTHTQVTTHNDAWKAGLFYYNHNDSAVILPKRFGIGWTINLARPAAWLLLLGFTAFIVFFICICMLAAA